MVLQSSRFPKEFVFARMGKKILLLIGLTFLTPFLLFWVLDYFASLPLVVEDALGYCMYVEEITREGKILKHDCGWEKGRKYITR